MRVVADAAAFDPYTLFDRPYPVGATIVKLEFDDEGCTGPVAQYSAMKKTEPNGNPAGGDWWWQRVDADRAVLEEGAPVRCLDCHTAHCAEPYGMDLTCKPEASEL